MTYEEMGRHYARRLAELLAPVQPMWGYVDVRALYGTDSSYVEPHRMGPPHPSWCQALWGSHVR